MRVSPLLIRHAAFCRAFGCFLRVEVSRHRFREVLDGMSRDELQARTGATLHFAPDCGVLRAPPLEG